jgi:hypothetical protein
MRMISITNAAERGGINSTVQYIPKKRKAGWLSTAAFIGYAAITSALAPAAAEQAGTSQAQTAVSLTGDPLVDSLLLESETSTAKPTQTDASAKKSAKKTKVAQETAPPPAPPAAAQGCTGPVDPYKNFACLDNYLGEGVLERFINYYRLEWGESGPPTDPNAPPSEREGWPQTPETTPPMPYTEFPTGALTSIGVTRPLGADSPLMEAIANTGFGHLLTDNNFQIYGWLNPGFNFSTNQTKFGNAPVAYAANPDVGELDQAVLYLDRWPDTVQTDHIDWGMRFSVIYGENYRYTNSYGIASWQFNKQNGWEGYDFPMAYFDLWIPQVLQGLEIRIGRYISIPDIEAQLAPNNITYTHSISYSWDNYTNEGVVTSWQLTKNYLLQLGMVFGTESPVWHYDEKIPNDYVLTKSNAAGFGPGVDPLYPDTTMDKDPGNQPSLVACFRYESDDGSTVVYPCLDGINHGNWGYNNLQWHGFTVYHKFDSHWHVDFETYWMQEDKVPNVRNPAAMALFGGGGTPFSPQYVPFNSPNLAYCDQHYATIAQGARGRLDCTVNAFGVVTYINYSPEPLDNITFRPEFYDDPNGWRTGTSADYFLGPAYGAGGAVKYMEYTLSWQHWLSPQFEFRPEVSWWHSFRTPAYNTDAYTGQSVGGPKYQMAMFAADAIIHF